MKRLIGLTVVALLMMACGDTPTAPTPVPPPTPPVVVPECERNHTGILILTNRSTSLLPRYFVVDGLIVGDLVPWGSSITRVVAAGVPHKVAVLDANKRELSTNTFIVNQCAEQRVGVTFQLL